MYWLVKGVQLHVLVFLCSGSNGCDGGRSSVKFVRLGHNVLCTEGGEVTGICLLM